MEVVEGERPILCDYNVITIGVSRQEVKELIQKNLFVRPDSGKWDEDMEADMLAAMVALPTMSQFLSVLADFPALSTWISPSN